MSFPVSDVFEHVANVIKKNNHTKFHVNKMIDYIKNIFYIYFYFLSGSNNSENETMGSLTSLFSYNLLVISDANITIIMLSYMLSNIYMLK